MTSPGQVFFRGAAFGSILLLTIEIILIYVGFQWFLQTKRKLIKEKERTVEVENSSLQSAASLQLHKEIFYQDENGEENIKSKEVEEKEYSLPWPEEVTSRLKRWLTPQSDDINCFPCKGFNPSVIVTGDQGPGGLSDDVKTDDQSFPCAHTKTMDAEWLNIIMNRLFLTLRSSKVFRNIWANKVSNKMNRKLKGNSFVSSIAITDLFLGENPPSFEGARLLKGISKELAIMGEVDIIYRGGASICIETHLANGTVVPMQVFMNDLNGTLRIRLPSERWADMIGFAFVEDPGVTFRVDSSLMENQMLKSMVNGVLSSIMRKTFLELWVLPSWRTAFLPLLEPSIEDWNEREEENKSVDHAKKHKINTIASRATQLWESGQLGGNIQYLLKRNAEKPKDCMGSFLFPPTILFSKQPEEIHNVFENPLLTDIGALLAEPLDEVNRARSISDRLKFPPSQEEGLFLPLAENSSQQPAVDESSGNNSVNSTWKEIKRKGDVSVQKKKFIGSDGVSEITRATMTISCDANRTFSIISNPLHFRHIYESFTESKLLFEDGNSSVHACSFQIGKSEKKLIFYQAKLNQTEDDVKLVAMRSIGGLIDETSNEFDTSSDSSKSSTLRQRPSKVGDGSTAVDTTVVPAGSTKLSQPLKSPKYVPLISSVDLEVDHLYLFGYQVTKISDSTCNVTVISQFSGDLQRLEVDFAFCRKLKQFIEELTQLTDLEQPISQSEAVIKKFFNAEDLKVTSEKLASYIGSAKTYLRTSSFKTGRRVASEDVATVENTETFVAKSVDASNLVANGSTNASNLVANGSTKASNLVENGSTNASNLVANGSTNASNLVANGSTNASNLVANASMNASAEELANVPYSDITIPAKDIFKVSIPFSRNTFDQSVVFKWEYVSRNEQSLNFGIHFVPHDQENLNAYTRTLPYVGSGTRILLPCSNFQSFSRPSFGVIPMSHLESGNIILIWNNTHALKNGPKNVVYKTHFQGNSKSYPECQAIVNIPRKSFVALPFIYDSSSPADKLSIESNTSTHVIPFALYFDEIPVESQLNQRKTIIPFSSSSKSGAISHTIDLSKQNGIYTLQWDNSQSIVSSRTIEFRVYLH